VSRRLRSVHARAEAGTTLVELLVVMVLLSVVSALVAGIAYTTLRQTSNAQVLTAATADAQTALDRVSRSLRVAVDPDTGTLGGDGTEKYSPGFVVAMPFRATYYTQVKNLTGPTDTTTGPELVDDNVVPSTTGGSDYWLVESVYAAAGTAPPYAYATTATTTHVLAQGLADPTLAGTPPLFTYRQPQYYNGPGSLCPTPAPGVAAAPSTVTANLWVGYQPGVNVGLSAASVSLQLTLSTQGANAPAKVSTARSVPVLSSVSLDNANNATSRLGTCL